MTSAALSSSSPGNTAATTTTESSSSLSQLQQQPQHHPHLPKPRILHNFHYLAPNRLLLANGVFSDMNASVGRGVFSSKGETESETTTETTTTTEQQQQHSSSLEEQQHLNGTNNNKTKYLHICENLWNFNIETKKWSVLMDYSSQDRDKVRQRRPREIFANSVLQNNSQEPNSDGRLRDPDVNSADDEDISLPKAPSSHDSIGDVSRIHLPKFASVSFLQRAWNGDQKLQEDASSSTTSEHQQNDNHTASHHGAKLFIFGGVHFDHERVEEYLAAAASRKNSDQSSRDKSTASNSTSSVPLQVKLSHLAKLPLVMAEYSARFNKSPPVQFLTDLLVYDLDKKYWRKITRMPQAVWPRCSAFSAAAVAPPNRGAHPSEASAFLFGGYPVTSDTNLYRFSFQTHEWSIQPASNSHILTGRWGHQMVVTDDSLYIIYGRNQRQCFNDVFCYSFELQQWTRIGGTKRTFYKSKSQSNQPEGRYGHSAALSIERQSIFVFGGVLASGGLTNELLEFSISKKKWRRVQLVLNMDPRAFHTATITDDSKMILYGGVCEDGNSLIRGIDEIFIGRRQKRHHEDRPSNSPPKTKPRRKRRLRPIKTIKKRAPIEPSKKRYRYEQPTGAFRKSTEELLHKPAVYRLEDQDDTVEEMGGGEERNSSLPSIMGNPFASSASLASLAEGASARHVRQSSGHSSPTRKPSHSQRGSPTPSPPKSMRREQQKARRIEQIATFSVGGRALETSAPSHAHLRESHPAQQALQRQATAFEKYSSSPTRKGAETESRKRLPRLLRLNR